MDGMFAVQPSRLERAFDVAAALVPAGAASWSAAKLGPLFDLPAIALAPAAAIASFLTGLAIMRTLPAVRMESRPLAQRTLDSERLLEALWEGADDTESTLLLDQPIEARMDAVAELLLDDPLPSPAQDSRVVQLFDSRQPQSALELSQRIDRYLGLSPIDAAPGAPVADAADSLRIALDDLRRSLRHA